MFPIARSYKLGYSHGAKTFYNASHLGVDLLVPENTPLHMPRVGTIVKTLVGKQGGQTIHALINGQLHRFMHLNKFVISSGPVAEGEVIALTGGNPNHKPKAHVGTSTAAHLHWDIYKGTNLSLARFQDFVDPLSLNWETMNQPIDIPFLFTEIWHRKPAEGDKKYFEKRLAMGTIKDKSDMILKMRYWYAVVYPNGKYSVAGDKKWQIEKQKVLGRK